MKTALRSSGEVAVGRTDCCSCASRGSRMALSRRTWSGGLWLRIETSVPTDSKRQSWDSKSPGTPAAFVRTVSDGGSESGSSAEMTRRSWTRKGIRQSRKLEISRKEVNSPAFQSEYLERCRQRSEPG